GSGAGGRDRFDVFAMGDAGGWVTGGSGALDPTQTLTTYFGRLLQRGSGPFSDFRQATRRVLSRRPSVRNHPRRGLKPFRPGIPRPPWIPIPAGRRQTEQRIDAAFLQMPTMSVDAVRSLQKAPIPTPRLVRCSRFLSPVFQPAGL